MTLSDQLQKLAEFYDAEETRITHEFLLAAADEITVLRGALQEANAFILAPAEDIKEFILARIRATLAVKTLEAEMSRRLREHSDAALDPAK